MKYVVTAEEMREYDKNTIESIGIPAMVLMERAALAAYHVAIEYLQDKQKDSVKALVIAGMGNNGADGLALARLLCEYGIHTSVLCIGNRAKASAQWKHQFSILNHYPIEFCNEVPQKEYTIVIDALFGVGLSREIEGAYKEAVTYINKSQGYKISLDIPSGICSDSGCVLGCAVKADVTVTFGFAKRGILLYPGCKYAGEVITADIGIGKEAFLEKKPGMFYYDEISEALLPRRAPAGNKGTFGKVLLIAGSMNMAGAALLAAKGAYRVGTGMVKVLSSTENREIIQKSLPDAMFGTYDELHNALKWADIVAIGPGLSQSDEAKRVLYKTITESLLPIIIDADGLNILAQDSVLQDILSKQGAEGRKIILTPHVGELSRLVNTEVLALKEKLWEFGMNLSKRFHCVVVAKDARTFTCMEGEPVCVNTRGNDGMAVAGCGDVLCGVITGLLAQNMACFQAAGVGVYLHAVAGDKASILRGTHGVMASDIVDCL